MSRLAGDCFDGHTPDIRPGDLVRVRGPIGAPISVSDIIVDDLGYSGPATETADGTIEVRGWARTAAGAAIPVGGLDSAEFRDGQLRGVPSEVVADTAAGAPVGGFVIRYAPDWVPDRNSGNVGAAGIRTSLLTTGGHAIGFGHTAPLPDEAQLIDGIDDTPGPALGCEGSPAARHAVTQISNATPGYLNAADLAGAGDVTFSGVSFEASAVELSVGGIVADATITGPAGSQTWTAAVPKSQLVALADGNLTASMISTTAAGDVAGVSKTLVKDASTPLAPQVTATDPVSPNPSLTPKVKGMAGATAESAAEDTSTVSLYANGTCTGPALASGTGQAFRTTGLPTTVADASTTTFHARTVDLAGNPSACSATALTYIQDAVAPPRPTLGDGSTTGAVQDSDAAIFFSSTEEPDVTFQCALDGGTAADCTSPATYADLGEGSHELEITATDLAGNVSDPLVAPWVVDMTVPAAPTMTAGAPSGRVSSRQATFSFGHNEPGVTFTCSRDGAVATACTSPVTYRKLSQGKHSLVVMAHDAAGHASPARVARWTVDTKGPKVTSRNPGQNAKNVKPGKTLKVTLNEKVTGATARNVKVFAAGSNKATRAVVRYNAKRSIIKINPHSVLRSGTRYSIELGRGIKDLAGNRLKPVLWRFTT